MNLSLIINFTRQDLIDRYSGSLLGGAWSFIMPLVTIIIYVVIFSKIMGAKLENFGAEFTQYGYSIYLVSGILAWNAFASILARTTSVFKDKAAIVSKVKISLLVLPVYIMISETIIYIISMIFFGAFLILIDFPISRLWLLIPLLYLLQLLLAYSLGLILAILSVFIRDIKELLNVVLQLWFWFTPIIYIITILPDNLQKFFQFNPMLHLMNAYRDIIIYHQLPAYHALSVLLLVSVLLLFLSQYLFIKLEKDIRDIL